MPAGNERLLQLLSAPSPDWSGIGALAARDGALCLALLDAHPLDHDTPTLELRAALTARLQTAGSDLLRAWLLLAASAPASSLSAGATSASLLSAECAHHLALEAGYRRPDEAFLGAMWLTLAQATVRTEAPPATTTGPDAVQRATALAERCGLPPTVIDALLVQHCLPEQLQSAHPLARILWSAVRLAASAEAAADKTLQLLSGLSGESLLALRTDVGYMVMEQRQGDGSRPPSLEAAPATAAALPSALRDAALEGLLSAAFAAPDLLAPGERLAMACRLLCGMDLPLVVVGTTQGSFRPLLTGHTLDDWFAECGLRIDDERSVVALAARSGTPATLNVGPSPGGRSLHDWQLARRLNCTTLHCVPLALPGQPAVALLPAAPGASESTPPQAPPLLTVLLRVAAAALLRTQAAREAEAARTREVEDAFRRHARALVHETNNPLTVIRSYVALLGQRNPGDGPLKADLAVIGKELERMSQLLRQIGHLPASGQEAPHCNVGLLLDELQALCAEPLFGRHGIRFELRKAVATPPVAMPDSALRQVLLNLFRNAAEALSPGGRFAVTVAGQATVDGRPCLEIRLLDDGPGLSRERLADLFGSRSSSKGGEHQGVGLAIVRELLGAWKASIVCRSQPGRGTSFQLLIPLENKSQSVKLL